MIANNKSLNQKAIIISLLMQTRVYSIIPITISMLITIILYFVSLYINQQSYIAPNNAACSALLQHEFHQILIITNLIIIILNSYYYISSLINKLKTYHNYQKIIRINNIVLKSMLCTKLCITILKTDRTQITYNKYVFIDTLPLDLYRYLRSFSHAYLKTKDNKDNKK